MLYKLSRYGQGEDRSIQDRGYVLRPTLRFNQNQGTHPLRHQPKGETISVAKPIILTVDDEIQVLNSIERDLRKAFASDYRIIKANSGSEALETIQRLHQRGSMIALFLVDQRMPGMTGVELLTEAMRYYPLARKVLLTAYADTEAAIASINRVGLDYYLMKPWDPPEISLYPVLTELLRDWAESVPQPYEGIRVAGTLWSARSHAVKDFLARNQIPYQWLDIETDEQARMLVENAAGDHPRLPVIFFPDGDVLQDPPMQELIEKIGLRSQPEQPFYDLVIIGAGPAGLAAAVYGASEGLRTLMIEKEAAGGQAGTSSRIENYLGFPRGLSGSELARKASLQARRFGAEILSGEVVGARAEDSYRYVRLSGGGEVSCRALLIATGVSVRRLEVPGVESLTGAGVYYGAAITEAAYYRGQDMVVVGGGNSAGQAAMFLSEYARNVSIICRNPLELSMSQYLIDQIAATKNICVLTGAEVAEAVGKNRLEAVVVAHLTGESQIIPAAAMFIFIGAVPHTEMVEGLVLRDPAGYILTGPDLRQDGHWPTSWTLQRDPFLLETSCPGVFAAGDVRHGSIKRIASAVGEGSVSVALIHQYLRTV